MAKVITWNEGEVLKGQVDKEASKSEIEVELSKLPITYQDFKNIRIIFDSDNTIEADILNNLKIMYPSWNINLSNHIIEIKVVDSRSRL